MSRQSIDIAGFKHGNPLPAASRMGPLVMSSIVAPVNPGSRDIPEGIDAQLDNLFSHVGEILAGAGAEWRHVVKMNFWVTDLKYRESINRPWLERFPDAGSRPARHTQQGGGAGAALVTCDVTAYVAD